MERARLGRGFGGGEGGELGENLYREYYGGGFGVYGRDGVSEEKEIFGYAEEDLTLFIFYFWMGRRDE